MIDVGIYLVVKCSFNECSEECQKQRFLPLKFKFPQAKKGQLNLCQLTTTQQDILTLYQKHKDVFLIQLCFKLHFECSVLTLGYSWNSSQFKLLNGDEQKEFKFLDSDREQKWDEFQAAHLCQETFMKSLGIVRVG